ncbi:MAG: hypothetical protein IT529_01060 [Burkholderiales bacterium]|nr:hypothetical protein [Burkholderiales bacterium]
MKKTRVPRCDIVLLVDEETGERGASGRFIPAPRSVEARVLREIRRHRRRVEVVPFAPPVAGTVARLAELAPRMVFNLTEWVEGDRSLDAAIAGLLEMLRIPYTGTGPDGLTLARDKVLARDIVASLGVPVPRAFPIESTGRIGGLPFPLIVKPRLGDGSDAVARGSVVRNGRELRERVRVARARAGGPVLCEEFIPGRDLYVGLLGRGPRVLPPVELVVRGRGRGAPRIATRRLKTDARYRSRWGVHYRRAWLAPEVGRELEAASRRIFHALKLRDYARLDFRLAPDGRWVFLEANPNPDLHPQSLNRNGCFSGVPYGTLIAAILEGARVRARRRV